MENLTSTNNEWEEDTIKWDPSLGNFEPKMYHLAIQGRWGGVVGCGPIVDEDDSKSIAYQCLKINAKIVSMGESAYTHLKQFKTGFTGFETTLAIPVPTQEEIEDLRHILKASSEHYKRNNCLKEASDFLKMLESIPKALEEINRG